MKKQVSVWNRNALVVQSLKEKALLAILIVRFNNDCGSEVSPPVNTEATGKAEFIPYREQPIRLFYKVSVRGIDSNINNITGVHLHNGIRNFNGTTIKELPVIQGHERNGILTVGNLTGSDNFSSELSGKGEHAVSSLIHYIDNDEVYLDIHTLDNPRGEIRGQVSRLP